VSASVLYMSMSLDGYIAGPNDEPGTPGGDGFDRLHEWFATPDGEFGRPSGPAGQLWDEIFATGAIVAGRRTVEQVDHWGGDNHGVPIFVPSHRPPGPSVANYPLVTYVNDGIESALAQAKAAAGDRNVWCTARTRRSGRSRPVCWTSCRSTRSRCCSVVAVGSSRCCRRASSWRSFG
jgi:dihydrofolate reductase